jgi:predicted MPP superfamily phosphohydrolase
MRHLFPSFTFGLIVFAVALGAHIVLLAWAVRMWPRIARIGMWTFVPCVSFSALPAFSRLVALETQASWANAVLSISLLEIVFVVVAAAPLLIMLVATRRAFRVAPLRRQDAPREPPVAGARAASGAPAAIGRRQMIETIGGAAVLGSTGLALGWGATRGRFDYVVNEVPVRIPGLPRALDGYVIAQISDIHAGLFVGERELRDAGAFVRAMKPDLLVVTGDLVDLDPSHAPAVARAIADLAPRDGTWAILGNHDYYAGADDVSAAVRAAGVNLLVNEGRVIRGRDGGGFALLGVDDLGARSYGRPGPMLHDALASVPPDLARVLLSHRPETFKVFAGQAALQLSGHTHGGQIAPARVVMTYPAGLYERDGSTLYVNRGLGVAGPPVRLGIPPEITKIVLVAG